ncbi:MAG: beta-ketoacyl synthase [Paludibacteraceae bacterium]|nr:beta-ketoacyl synthase [Paludibacteraceae bacterium]
MIYCLAHHIISPLGDGSRANWEAVQAGRSGLKYYTDRFKDVEPFCASLFVTPQTFVPLCIRSAKQAIEEAQIDPASKEVVFILSTTKGDNLDLITPAQKIAAHFGNPNAPIVVSNACTSGVCAQITAKRLLEAGLYKHAVLIGCDIQTQFIVSGFQAFKALSDEPCLPFSENRKGLNLGEAAATIIWSVDKHEGWQLVVGSIHNDANHISAPSRTGEGAYRCLLDVLQGVQPEEIDLLGVHGTATPYNDAMEQVAIERAGLQTVPISALKPYFGHTMGTAGVLETIICMLTAKKQFIKMLSGFGGINAAIRLQCE